MTSAIETSHRINYAKQAVERITEQAISNAAKTGLIYEVALAATKGVKLPDEARGSSAYQTSKSVWDAADAAIKAQNKAQTRLTEAGKMLSRSLSPDVRARKETLKTQIEGSLEPAFSFCTNNHIKPYKPQGKEQYFLRHDNNGKKKDVTPKETAKISSDLNGVATNHSISVDVVRHVFMETLLKKSAV